MTKVSRKRTREKSTRCCVSDEVLNGIFHKTSRMEKPSTGRGMRPKERGSKWEYFARFVRLRAMGWGDEHFHHIQLFRLFSVANCSLLTLDKLQPFNTLLRVLFKVPINPLHYHFHLHTPLHKLKLCNFSGGKTLEVNHYFIEHNNENK